MTTTRTIRLSLIAGHAAVAMLALAAIHFAPAVTHIPQWHAAGQLDWSIADSPQRLPASRRAERALDGALND